MPSENDKQEGALAPVRTEDVGWQDADADMAVVSSTEAFHDAFPGQAMPTIINPVDGLPQLVDPPTVERPPFSHEYLVCIEDDREWVEVFVEEARDDKRFAIHEMKFIATSRYDVSGREQERRRYLKEDVKYAFGIAHVDRVPVRPVRPKCKFFSEFIEHPTDIIRGDGTIPISHLRFCHKFVSAAGGPLWLQDESKYACSAREPQDETSAELLRKSTEQQILRGKNRVKLPMFDLIEPENWAKKAEGFGRESVVALRDPSDAFLLLCEAGITAEELAGKYIVLADDGWQPPDDYFNGLRHDWILRMRADSPTTEDVNQARSWPTDYILAVGIPRNVEAVVAKLREGVSVAVVGSKITGMATMFTALVMAKYLDISPPGALHELWPGGTPEDVLPSLSHRLYLKRGQDG